MIKLKKNNNNKNEKKFIPNKLLKRYNIKIDVSSDDYRILNEKYNISFKERKSLAALLKTSQISYSDLMSVSKVLDVNSKFNFKPFNFPTSCSSIITS